MRFKIGQTVVFKYPEKDMIESRNYLVNKPHLFTVGKSYTILENVLNGTVIVKNNDGDRWHLSEACFISLTPKRNLPSWF